MYIHVLSGACGVGCVNLNGAFIVAAMLASQGAYESMKIIICIVLYMSGYVACSLCMIYTSDWISLQCKCVSEIAGVVGNDNPVLVCKACMCVDIAWHTRTLNCLIWVGISVLQAHYHLWLFICGRFCLQWCDYLLVCVLWYVFDVSLLKAKFCVKKKQQIQTLWN